MNIKVTDLLAGLLMCNIMICSIAQAKDWAIGGNLGVATGDDAISSLSQQLSENGINASTNSSGRSRLAWQLFAAYQYNAAFGVEVAYIDLGDIDVDFTGAASSIDAFISSINNIDSDTAQGFRLSATYRYELVEKLQLKGRLGVFRWDSEYTYYGASVVKKFKNSGSDISFGVALEYVLTENISANLAWDHYIIDSEAVNLFSPGLSYKF
ncbi:hypothetical protein MNBD_GAMMA11-1593 [hydrothermal vent metagenome]|uniref:Outer membrane protein OmpA-like transmembrane domain-containing protein n=1 Tax=hydrothermal vent metagenome TaxID=652676 RepID=A0A3B0X7W7_9ZZZZ